MSIPWESPNSKKFSNLEDRLEALEKRIRQLEKQKKKHHQAYTLMCMPVPSRVSFLNFY